MRSFKPNLPMGPPWLDGILTWYSLDPNCFFEIIFEAKFKYSPQPKHDRTRVDFTRLRHNHSAL